MASNTNRRFYSRLNENDINTKLSLGGTLIRIVFSDSGYIGRYVDHHFSAREFNHDPVPLAESVEAD